MATYYLRISGSDSNDGLTPATAWRTFTKALGSSGISSSDTLWVGPGIYRESVTVSMTTASAETFIIGDIDGVMTGDSPGEIQWTGYFINDKTLSTLNGVLLNLNGRDFLTFKNISFTSPFRSTSVSGNIIGSTTTTATNIKFLNCFFIIQAGNTPIIALTIGFGISANWTIDSCYFFSNSDSSARPIILISLTTGTGSDYDANIRINNCLFHSCVSGAIGITSTGTSSQEGGGVYITNCTFFGSDAIQTLSSRISGSTFTYPIMVTNCIVYGSSDFVSSTELGAIIENYNVIYVTSTPRTNVLIGPQSISDGSTSPLIEFGQSFLYKFNPRPFGSISKNSPLLCHGNRTISPINDIFNNSRPEGSVHLLHHGTATSSTEKTLVDSTKTFGSSNNLNGYTIKIIDGLGAGQTKTINGNTDTIVSGDGLWITPPNTTSRYVIYQGPISTTSLTSSASSITLEDNQSKWGENFWNGFQLRITSGVASGETFIVSGNSPTVLTGYSSFSITPSSGDAYELSWGSGSSNSGINYIHTSVGCFSVSNTSIKETGIVLSGINSIKLFGPSSQDFSLPVSGATTLSVWSYKDFNYIGINPSMSISNGSGFSISDRSVTGIAGTGVWEQLSLSFTGSSAGYIDVRLQNNSTGTCSCYFDSFSSV